MALLKCTWILLQLVALQVFLAQSDSTGDDDDGEISVPRSPRIVGPTEVNMTYPLDTLGPFEPLTCTFEGSPTPLVVWLKDTKLISDKDADYSIQFDDTKVQARLDLNSIFQTNGTSHHLGVYTCIGLNFLGRAAKTFVLSFSLTPS